MKSLLGFLFGVALFLMTGNTKACPPASYFSASYIGIARMPVCAVVQPVLQQCVIPAPVQTVIQPVQQVVQPAPVQYQPVQYAPAPVEAPVTYTEAPAPAPVYAQPVYAQQLAQVSYSAPVASFAPAHYSFSYAAPRAVAYRSRVVGGVHHYGYGAPFRQRSFGVQSFHSYGVAAPFAQVNVSSGRRRSATTVSAGFTNFGGTVVNANVRQRGLFGRRTNVNVSTGGFGPTVSRVNVIGTGRSVTRVRTR